MKRIMNILAPVCAFIVFFFYGFHAEAQFSRFFVIIDHASDDDIAFMQSIGAEEMPSHPDLYSDTRSYIVTDSHIVDMENYDIDFRTAYQVAPKTKGLVSDDESIIGRAKTECDARSYWYDVNNSFDSATASTDQWFEMNRSIAEFDERIAYWEQTYSFVSVEELDLGYTPLVTELDGEGNETSQQQAYDDNIKVIRIKKGTARKPTVLITGGAHGNEWIGAMTAMYIADRAISALADPLASQNEEIASLFESVDLMVIPLINPKGYRFTWAHECPDDAVDVIDIVSPNYLHRDQVLQALKAGKHVLCEKPIALTSIEAQDCLEQARKYPELKIMEAFMYRHHPQWQRARQLVVEGKIGELRTIQTFFSYFLVDATNIRNMADIGGGGLMDIGCYRGLRHRRGLPVRGQRTRTNARTRKGKRPAIAGKKKAGKK